MGGNEIGGRYSLEKKIGEGSTATVYRARDQQAGNRQVALKVLKLKKDTDPFFMEALKQEFNTLTQLNHPNLAKVYDFAAYQRQWVLSEEYVAGRDFLTVCQKANLNTVFELIVQALRALDYLHLHGYLHLDLKPENLIIGKANALGAQQLKVIDFGLAREQKDWKSEEADLSGTLPYVAPEIFLGESPSPASDLYSWAMILYKTFSGSFPFSSQEPQEIFQEQIYGHHTVSHPLDPAIPEELGIFLLQCMSKDPSKRPQSVAEFLESLNRVLEEDFTLRSPRMPGNVLAESSFVLHPETFTKIEQEFSQGKVKIFHLIGPEGSGKTYLANRLKEQLQLMGQHPLWIGAPEDISKLKESELKHFTHCFVDIPKGKRLNAKQQKALSRIPTLILERGDPGEAVSGDIFLPPVTEEVLVDFLGQELRSFPQGYSQQVHEETGGNPLTLGNYLEALRDFGWILWDDHGWRWVEEAAGELSRVWQLREKLLQERWEQTEEFLAHAPLGLNLGTLAGLLNTEEKILKALLEEWAQRGRLRIRGETGEPLYSLVEPAGTKPKAGLPQDWDWILDHLISSYQAQRYQVGTHWVEQSLNYSKDKIPDRVRLWGARHLVALGHASEALEFLPSSPPRELKELGLFHEIQSRAFLLLGTPDKTLSHCNEAMVAFQKEEDLSGVARIHNLRALMA
ncbi:MAG: protein kinase, partial [bacterium]|nr:protein kinase [bacterium]